LEKNKLLVSIIVRTKDRPKLLEKALQSIAGQTYRPLEVVLVNDGGCDLDIGVIKNVLGDMSLNYIRLEENMGRAHAGNVGIENAKGEYVGFLDDDDEFYPEHVETLVSFLEQSEYKIAYTDSLMVFKGYDPHTYQMKEERSELVFSEDYDYDKLVFENYIPFMCLMFGKKVLVNSGGLHPDFDLYEDWDLLIRIGNKYPFHHIKKITANYNQWDVDLQISQRNRNADLLRESYLKVVNKHFDKITPYRIHRYVSAYYHARYRLKELKNELELLKELGGSNYIGSLETTIQEMQTQTNSLEAAIKERDSHISILEILVKEKDAHLNNLDAAVMERDRQIAARDQQIAAIESALTGKEAYIQVIESGHAWKLLTKYFRLRDKLLPVGTKRRLFMKLLMKTALKPKDVFKNVNKTNLKKFFYYLDKADPLTVEKKVERKLSYEASGEEPSARAIDGNGYALTSKTNCKDYFNSLFEMNTQKGGDYVSLSCPQLPETDIKLIAFYLPQFHPIQENDEWWGKGFTEWTNVTRAVPQFTGHYQPRLPGELGFYDLRMPEVQRRQIELATQYGIRGFCFHFYWFDGKTLLETPLKNFAEDFDFPFCINWANENWTRRWDGEENEILISQKHSQEDDIKFIKHISQYLLNKNYIRIKSRPLLIVYRPALLPSAKATAERWREWCHKNGIGEIYLAATHSFEHIDPRDIGFDAVIEFPPNTFPLKDVASRLDIVNPNFKGLIFDYKNAIELSKNSSKSSYKKFRGICPTWDNEARKPGRGTILINSSPNSYKEWLSFLCEYTIKNFDPEERLIFINAWNEWAEGTYLEPDRRYGYAYLQATAEALAPLSKGSSPLPGEWKILFISHDACKGGAQAVLLTIISWFKKHTFADIRILCLDSGELLPRFRELGDTLVLSEMRDKRITEEELARNLREFCGGAPDLIYCNSVASGREYRLLRSLDTPIIMHFHELEMSIKRYAADCVGDVIAHSAHFIAISEAVRDNLGKNYGVDETKISTVYSSITPDSSIKVARDSEKRRIRSRLGVEKNKFLVFGCGLGMVFRKGADLFIDVARILRNRGFGNFHFYWMGDFDNKERDSRYGVWADHVAALKKEGLDKYVTFLGFKDNPREYMQAGDVFLLSSREEPVGLVGLEAAECGLPVICFADAGGMPDFVGDDAGFIVPYGDVEAMAGKVAVLIESADLRQQLGDRAREKVLSRFAVEHTTPHVLSVCRMVAQKKPAISVIIPNYNHARYLQKRLDSVFNQTFKDFEVILLDDDSTDNSLEILNNYADHADVRILRNEKNSGSPFRQWIKGIDLARADIIWIAESDDMCEPQFLETLLQAFRNPEVKLAYANSHVIDEQNNITGDYENGEYLMSLSQTKWKQSYLVSATEEINDGLGVKDTILNISAVLFRRFDVNEEFRKTLEGMRIAGDWYFVANVIKDGRVHYDAAKLNYHRRHAESVIGKTITEKKMEDFFREFCMVQQFIFDNYRLDDYFYHKWEGYLRKQWNDFYPGRPFEELQRYYPFDEMREKILQRRKHLAIERACKEGSDGRKGDYRRHGASNVELLREVEDLLPAVQDLSAVSIKKLFENVGDEFYFWLLTEGHEHIANQALMSLLPTMPDEQTQINWTGRSGYETLHQAFLAFSLFKKIINNHHKDIRSCDRILDFGCGWGRLIRFFLKDIEPEGLWGIDCYEEAITICKNSNLRCNFESIDVMPPTHLPENFFDAIYLYSVFSHLSEEAHMAWLLEFRRILKPGGVVIATTRPRHFLVECDALRRNKDVKGFQHGAIASFQDIKKSLSDYDNGRFCHSPTGGGGVLSTSFYGETAIPKKYVIEHWTKHFSLVAFIYDDEHKSFDQNVIYAKK
jgi:glycosyltransferase involved in cell wall biosynthesis/SAM-dependent methyltransferase